MSDEEKRVEVAYTETEANTIRLNLHNETMVKMHNNLSERIGELEAWNKQNVGIAQYNLWKEEIAELKEVGIKQCQRINTNEEVLRKLTEQVIYYRDKLRCAEIGVDPLWYEDNTLEGLLEKLDVGKTEKKEPNYIKCEDCWFTLCAKNCAGHGCNKGKPKETEKKEVGFEQSPFGSSSYTVQSPFGSSSYTAQASEGNGLVNTFVPLYGKPPEPREEDKENMVFATFDKRTHFLGKLEDLKKIKDLSRKINDSAYPNSSPMKWARKISKIIEDIKK